MSQHFRTPLAVLAAVVLAIVGTAAFPGPHQAAVPGDAQNNRDSDLAAANQLRQARRFDDAQAAYESLLDAARVSGDVRLEARSLIGIGNVQLTRGRYPQAREYASRGLELAARTVGQEDIGRANLILSVAAAFMGDRPEARARAEQSVAAFEDAGNRVGRAQATLALLRSGTTLTPEETERLGERAVADARAGGDAGVEASALHHIGDDNFGAGEYAAALTRLELAAALYASIHDDANLGTVYNSIGRVYRAHGQLPAALEYQLKALAVHERGAQSFLELQSLNAVSAVYLMLGDSVKARSYLERALAVAEQTGSPRVQDFLRANLANILSSLGDFERAAALFQGVIERDLDPNVTARYSQLSFALRKLARHEDALRAADSAVTRCLAGNVQAATDCLGAFEARAYAHLAMGDVASALRDITTVLDRLEAARGKLVPSDFLKLDYLRSGESAYSLAIRLQLQQGRIEAALETAELARSRAFIDLLASRDVKVRPPAAPAPLPLRGSASAFIPSDLSSLAIAPPARTSDLAATARRLKSTLLMYWTTPDALFIWVVSPEGRVRSARVDVLASKVSALVRATMPFEDTPPSGAPKAVVTRGGKPFAVDAPRGDAWRELYDLLVRPVRHALPTASGSLLTIVTHGALGGVPFAALRDERGRYLLEDFTLHYAPAGAVLQFTGDKRRPDGRGGPILIVADPIVPKQAQLGRPLAPLPGARDEALAIARQVPAGRRTTLIGPDATEVRVGAAIERNAIVHFATHAVARDDAPFESFLALGADAAGDGLMTAEDVYRMNLNADLVVLTACRSGGARVSGDGIAAFARAFIYAGTPSIIASLWDVPDVATVALVANFYREWWAGAAKGRALRTAQLQMLRDLRLGRISVMTAAGSVVVPEHPIFWAGLALIGEPE